jgi:hypothetical protein
MALESSSRPFILKYLMEKEFSTRKRHKTAIVSTITALLYQVNEYLALFGPFYLNLGQKKMVSATFFACFWWRKGVIEASLQMKRKSGEKVKNFIRLEGEMPLTWRFLCPITCGVL